MAKFSVVVSGIAIKLSTHAKGLKIPFLEHLQLVSQNFGDILGKKLRS